MNALHVHAYFKGLDRAHSQGFAEEEKRRKHLLLKVDFNRAIGQ